MNLQLLQSFGHNYPEDFDGILDCVSIAITCSFNRFGSLLAVGCNDGRIVIFDFVTRGVSKVINAHVHPVCSLSWSRNGRRLLSASTDNTVSIWSVLTGECERTYRFSSPVLRVQFNPRKDHEFLVCPLKYQAILIDTNDDQRPVDIPADDDDLNIVAAYERRGEYVFTGNGRGRVAVYGIQRVAPRDRLAVHLAAAFRVASSGSGQVAVKQIEFARRGDTLLVNGSDRVIRVYATRDVLARGAPANGADAEQFVAVQKLQDLVNKTIWKKCVFSGDGEYVCAGSARQHALYIWEVQSGTLTKILHGTKGEFLLDVIWHPLRPIIASVSNGVVSIWAEQQVENWSAFAPDFKELDENVEYEERESEFDEDDEDKRLFLEREQATAAANKKSSNGNGDDDSLIDVDRIEPIPQVLSSDEEEEDSVALVYLPVAPEIEEPEDLPAPPNPASTGPAATAAAPFGSPSSNAAAAASSSNELLSVTPNGKKRTQKGGTRVSAALSSGTAAGAHRQVNIDLPGGPANELHPLLQSVGSKRPAVSLPAGVSATVPSSTGADAAESAPVTSASVTVGSAPSGGASSHKIPKVSGGHQHGHAHGGHHQHKNKGAKSKKSVW